MLLSKEPFHRPSPKIPIERNSNFLEVSWSPSWMQKNSFFSRNLKLDTLSYACMLDFPNSLHMSQTKETLKSLGCVIFFFARGNNNSASLLEKDPFERPRSYSWKWSIKSEMHTRSKRLLPLVIRHSPIFWGNFKAENARKLYSINIFCF